MGLISVFIFVFVFLLQHIHFLIHSFFVSLCVFVYCFVFIFAYQGWPCGSAKFRQHYIFAHKCANFCIYAEYAEMRSDVHRKKWRMASPSLYLVQKLNHPILSSALCSLSTSPLSSEIALIIFLF